MLKMLWSDRTSEIGRLIRFGIVGFAAMGVYWLIATNLMRYMRIGPVIASVCAHVLAGIFSYIGHLFFSFGLAPDHSNFGSKFLLVAILAILINIGVVRGLATLDINASVSICILSVLIPVFNFAASRFWVFAKGLDDMRNLSKRRA